ncbi:MAG: hypothetical protein ACXVP5_07190, partial [Tumebacillaceae bacterium]
MRPNPEPARDLTREKREGAALVMRTIEELIEDVHREAIRAPFPIDEVVYRRVGRDPFVPVLYAGSLGAPVCVF